MNILKDKSGKIVIAQYPNTPLWLAIFFFLLKYFTFGVVFDIASLGLVLSLLWWAYLELLFGVNYFRRTLGFVVGSVQVWHLVVFVFGV